MIDGLAGFGESARHVAGAVNPKDDERGCADVVKAMRFPRRDVGCVVPAQARGLAVDLDFAVAFQQRDLLAAVVAVHGRASARRERGEAGGEHCVRRALRAHQERGDDAIAPLELWNGFDLYDVRGLVGNWHAASSPSIVALEAGDVRNAPRMT